MSVDKVLVWELFTVNRLTTGSVETGKVTSLQHELGNHSVKDRSLVTESLLTSAKGSEVLSGLWDIRVQLESDTAQWLALLLEILK